MAKIGERNDSKGTLTVPPPLLSSLTERRAILPGQIQMVEEERSHADSEHHRDEEKKKQMEFATGRTFLFNEREEKRREEKCVEQREKFEPCRCPRETKSDELPASDLLPARTE